MSSKGEALLIVSDELEGIMTLVFLSSTLCEAA